MRRALAAIAAALAIAAAVIAGCGSSDDGQTGDLAPQHRPDPVVRSAAATRAAGSSKVAFRGSVEVAGQKLPISGGGAVDFKRSRARLSIATPLPGIGELSMDQILDGQTLYVRAPDVFSFLPGGGEWLKIDLAEAARAKGIDVTALRQLSVGGDPSTYVALLAVAGDARRVGAETLRGVPTTRYAARVDVRRLASAADPDLRRSVQRLGVRTVPLDVWLDDRALVRRLHVATRTDATPVPATVDLTIDFSDFGTKVDATRPADDDTIDVTGTAAGALQLLG